MAKTLNQFLEGTGILKVKSPDEQRFVDKHVAATIADRNGNGDDVFKGSKVKKIDRRKERHGYESGEDAKVYEEVEQISEKYYVSTSGREHRVHLQTPSGQVDAIGQPLHKSKLVKTFPYGDSQSKQTSDDQHAAAHAFAKKMNASMKEEVDLEEKAGYSAKAGAAGKDLGKPGKNFAKIARGAAEKYGSEAAGKRVAGAVLKKLRKEDRLIDLLDTVTESQAFTMVTVFNSLSEENQNMFLSSCETEEGVEKMLDFSIQNRGAE